MMTVIFDLGNVLIKADHEITHKILILDYEIPEERARLFFKNEEYFEFSRGRINGTQFYQTLINKYLKPRSKITYEQIVDAQDKHMHGVDDFVLGIIDKISKSPHRLIFWTNTNEWQTRRERELIDLRAYSNTVIRSNELGMRKQDMGAFPHVFQKYKIKQNEAIMVDDLPEIIKEANECGVRGILYENPQKLKSDLEKIIAV